MRVKYFNEFINEELRKVVSDRSSTGRTKFIDWIWNEPSSDKSPSAGVSLKDKLKEEEFQDLIKDPIFKNLTKIPNSSKAKKLAITLNNIQFLKDKQKERGDLYCEYCGKGPLIIYDIKRGSKFNRNDGATCDHKQPKSKGGDKFDYSNLAVCCYSCNQKKKNMSWEEWSVLIS